MAIDPVCKMEVDETSAAATSEYKGQTYYFCAPGCKAAFEKEPEKYLSGQGEGHSGHGHEHQEIQGLMLSAREKALEQAVADGWITPEQAEWMQSHMGQGFYDPGDCDGNGPPTSRARDAAMAE